MMENLEDDLGEAPGLGPLNLAAAAAAAAAWGGGGLWPEQDPMMGADFASAGLHAANASTAAFHADVAAKQAAVLAQWVQYLQVTVATLHNKVQELEQWRKTAIEDVRKLREEHRALKGKIAGEEAPLPPKSKSTPALSSVTLGEPMRIAPPGLVLSPPPGKHGVSTAEPVQLSRVQISLDSSPSHDGSSLHPPTPFSLPSGNSENSLSDGDAGHLEGVSVGPAEVDGIAVVRAEWRIGALSSKLRNVMGRPLVSPPFAAAGMQDMRLMIVPDGKDTAKGPRTKRQKELYQKKVTEGPLEGSLKLKAPASISEADQEIEYYLKVGATRVGPLRHNFAESTVSGCDDFGVDWLAMLEPDASLTVCVEILSASGASS